MPTIEFKEGTEVMFNGNKYTVKRNLGNGYLIIGDSGVRSVRVKVCNVTASEKESPTNQEPTVDFTFIQIPGESPLPALGSSENTTSVTVLFQGSVVNLPELNITEDGHVYKFNKSNFLGHINVVISKLTNIANTRAITVAELEAIITGLVPSKEEWLVSYLVTNLYHKQARVDPKKLCNVLKTFAIADLAGIGYNIHRLWYIFKSIHEFKMFKDSDNQPQNVHDMFKRPFNQPLPSHQNGFFNQFQPTTPKNYYTVNIKNELLALQRQYAEANNRITMLITYIDDQQQQHPRW